jgi:hypothetical protein
MRPGFDHFLRITAMTTRTGKVKNCLLAAFAAIVGSFAVFRLPFRFPPRQKLVSYSYAFGFNNGVAVLAIAGLLGLVALWWLWRLKTANEASDDSSRSFLQFSDDGESNCLPLWLFIVMALVYAAVTVALYWFSLKAPSNRLMWEARHFLYRIRLYQLYKLTPYVDFQAEYGPALMYPPAWLHMILSPLGVSIPGAYFFCHWLMDVVGVGCLFYLLSHLGGPRGLKMVAFVLVSVAAFGPWMGLNGAVLRYTLPFASVLFAHRFLNCSTEESSLGGRAVGTFALIAILMAANILISPEIAVAFSLGWLAYLILIARRNSMVLVASPLAMLVAGVIGGFTLPTAYYGSLLSFSAGAGNLPIIPAPHILLFLVTLFLLVPPMLAKGWHGGSVDAPLVGAMGALCVVMVPGGLGRCDPPHVLYYSLVTSTFLMVAMANRSRLAFSIYALAYASVFIGMMGIVNLSVFFGLPRAQIVKHPFTALKSLRNELRNEVHPPTAGYLAALDKYPRLGLPFASFSGDEPAETYIVEKNKLKPEYYVATVGVYSQPELDHKLRDISQQDLILVPDGSQRAEPYDHGQAYLYSIGQWFLRRPRLKYIHDDIDAYASVAAYIEKHFTQLEKTGSWVVMKRNPDNLPSPATQR